MDFTTLPFFEYDKGRMPVVGIGTFQAEGDICRKAVCTALEMGYRHVDTARMYKNEAEVGRGIKDSGVDRKSIFLTTKLQKGELDPAGVHRSCSRSLIALDTDYIDLLLVHWPEDFDSLGKTLDAMAMLREQGRIRHIGVSNFPPAWMRHAFEISAAPIFCNQVEYHPYLSQEPLHALCSAHNTALVAYSPLARGNVCTDARLAQIGGKYGKTGAQVALRWLVRQPNVIAIPKGSSKQHIRENIDIFDFELDAADLKVIAGLEKNKRLISPPWGPDWEA